MKIFKRGMQAWRLWMEIQRLLWPIMQPWMWLTQKIAVLMMRPMARFFSNRRPWAAAIVAILSGPCFGMLYLGRGVLGMAYLLGSYAAMGLPFVLAHAGFVPFEPGTLAAFLVLVLQIGGAYHGYRLAKEKRVSPDKWFARWYVLLLIMVLADGAIALCHVHVYQEFTISSPAMIPTLQRGDDLVSSPVAYRNGRNPARGDVIVFRQAASPNAIYIERIIGLPGDKVQMIGGAVHINGAQIPQAGVPAPVDLGTSGLAAVEETLPNGKKYITLTNPAGPFRDTAVFEVPPGNYFMLGDNRDNASDSRSTLGFAPRANIIGKAVVVIWNGKSHKIQYRTID